MASQRMTLNVTDVNKATEYAPHPSTSGFEEVRATPASRNSNRNANYAFTRTALVFKDRLNEIRSKNVKVNAKVPPPQAPLKKQPTIKTEEIEMSPPSIVARTPPLDGRIRILRAVQHALLSTTSVAIAVLQSLTYVKYEQTKDISGAWPQSPTLFPTLILLAVAGMALLFDLSSLVAYMFPTTPVAKTAYGLAIKLHYWITALKTFAYTIAASVCRAGFSMGGQNDLWGWSCSAQGQEMAATNDAHMNCMGNTVAWALSLLNILVEVIGVLITQMMESNKRKITSPGATSGGNPNATSDDNAAHPLLTQYGDLEALGDDVQGQLKNTSTARK